MFFAAVAAQCLDEQAALQSIYNQMGGPTWIKSTGWNTGSNYCNWYGIVCNGNGNVVVLNLDNNNVTGQLPSNIECMPFLQTLSLNNNKMASTIPSTFCNLQNLQYLQVSNAGFVGSLPTCICTMQHLQYFYMDNNLISGEIPSCVGNMTFLREMHLQCDDISGSVPTGFNTLPYLIELRVQCNTNLDCTSLLSQKTNFIYLCGDYQCSSCSIVPTNCPATIEVQDCGTYYRQA